MIAEPWFWRDAGPVANTLGLLLSPLGSLYAFIQRSRIAHTTPARAPAPVICVGGAMLGGVGKTPFALLLADIVERAGAAPAFLTRGYGGQLRGPVRVDENLHGAEDVGDEALLLAARAPTIVARERPAGAAAAAAIGAEAIIMDDGFQNPSLEKSLSFLLTPAEDPCGNGHVFPAGPLREPLRDARARADAEVIVTAPGAEPIALSKTSDASIQLSAQLRSRHATLPPTAVAFCGIARPERFFEMLEKADVAIVERRAFPDHHAFNAKEIAQLKEIAATRNAALLTTEKDFVRMKKPDRDGISFVGVEMIVDDEEALQELVSAALVREATNLAGAAQ